MVLFRAGELTITPIDSDNLPALLEVYRHCEDFFALGPVPVASVQMIEADIGYSRDHNGQYCAIRDAQDRIIGVLYFIAKSERPHTSSLPLLMIAAPWRGKGYGRAVMHALEAYLKENFGAVQMISWAQTNNREAIQFWRGVGYHLSPEPRSQPDGTATYQMTKAL